MDVPAFCDSCGTVFRSGIVVIDAAQLTLSGNTAGPCPKCGQMGHIPDGVFNFIGNTIEILSAPQRTIDELTRLAKIIHEAREKRQTPEAVANKIQEELPALSGLAATLPRTRPELYSFLALIIAVLSLISQVGKSERPSTNITVNQTINQVYVETYKKTAGPPQALKPPKKIGRNTPCPCGSGRKYKKCCGKLR